MAEMDLEGIRLGIVRGISYGLFGKPDVFMPQLRELGASLVRVYVYWSQVEPEPGNYTFEVVDAFLDQLDGSEEVWITVCSSSPWATQQATDFLAPSPAKDLDAYHQFVHRMVRHCEGRVRLWQCDNEPSNVGLTWMGTAQEYVAQLEVLHRAVKDAEPTAAVVLGGAPYALPASAPDSRERLFYDVLLENGRDAFDAFDLHLYGPAEQILSDIETARSMMRRFGYQKPILVGEYNAAGVRRTVRWNLAPEIPGYENPLSIMDLLFGKFVLMGYEGAELGMRHPSGETFALVAEQLKDVEDVTRIDVPEQPELFLFDVRRRTREPLLVVWQRRNSFDGEDEPAVAFDWPWPAAHGRAVDAFGRTQPMEVREGRLHLQVSLTPLFVTAADRSLTNRDPA